MNDDSKNLNDIFGMSDIDKIFEDIERDLSGETAAEVPASQEDFDFAKFLLVPQDDVQTESTEPVAQSEDFGIEKVENIEPPSFYRETIKPAPRKSFFKTAVVLFFVCTVGMGMLGFGIGLGWGYVQVHSDIVGIFIEEGGNNPDGVFFTGASYVFETLEPAVAGLSDVVELLAPSVVGITTYRQEIQTRQPDRFRDSPWGAMPERMPIFSPTSYGSGIIFADSDDRIFIATNLYVVRPGYRWDVSIAGSAPIPAFPVNSNPYYDLAVLYVYKASILEAGIDSVAFASFGNSDEMRIGDVVLAIGNAMGEGTSVTRGIISAAEREILIPGRMHPLTVLQTDAAINYGNSGGPLINGLGEIVGININQASGLIIGSSQAEGMGYSISSNIAAPILLGIAANYRAPAIGILGVSLHEDDYRMAEYWGIPELGVRVISVQEGRPAYIAGIRPNDVITGFGGRPIFDMQQLIAAIQEREIGDTVEIRILRGGSFALTVQVELAMMIRETF
ncbi:MAG: S1C family serine protease [Defluviitaleaceae bacterium]|nr:S1C family serine protease [Defluviitaleaceae bacterium]MCL2263636.1 S1C family serine protease [Defluviitaleaceae bacterium]